MYFRSGVPQSFSQVMEADGDKFNRFFHLMLEAGIAFAPSAFEAGFVSAAHGQKELERTFDAARHAFSHLRD